jgi:exopolysaccharide production protein ExoQ
MLFAFARWLERAYCYFAISVTMGAYVYLPAEFANGGELPATSSQPGQQNLWNTFSEALIFVGLVVLFALRWKQVLNVLRSSVAVNAFVLLALASATWSLDPELTLRRVFSLMTTVGLAYYFASRFEPYEVIRMFSVAATVAGLASAVLALALPNIGQMSAAVDGPELAGDWDGVFTHKNTLGASMVIAVLMTGWLLTQERRHRLIRLASLVVCIAVAVMSYSRTAQVSIVMLLPLGIMVRSVRLAGLLRWWVFFLLLLVTLIASVFGVAFFDDIVFALGKDPTLTGRLPLWQLLSVEIAQRPLLGYGYGAFFAQGNRELDYIAKMIGWIVPGAHQGYIDLAIQVGIVGLLIGLWIEFSTIVRAVAAVRDRTAPWAVVAAVYTLILLVSNLAEASLMHSLNPATVLLPYFASSLCLLATRRKADAKAKAPLPAGAMDDALPGPT